MKNKTIEKKPLTPRQRDVFEWVRDQIQANGISPSNQEIGNEFSTSVGNVSRLIGELVDKGWLKKDPGAHPVDRGRAMTEEVGQRKKLFDMRLNDCRWPHWRSARPRLRVLRRRLRTRSALLRRAFRRRIPWQS